MENIVMPERMCVCWVCSAECVREFGPAPQFITADGKTMDKYIIAGRYIFCGRCDWKLSQITLGNKYAWADYANEFTENQIFAWGCYTCERGFNIIAEVKRLKRNEKARQKRAAKSIV
jgi:hypothetical protein